MPVVNIRKGERYDVYIGRPSVFGNPFVIGRDGDRKEVLEKYRRYIAERPELQRLARTLSGKTLGCYCSPLPCHGEILEEFASSPLIDKRAVKNAKSLDAEASDRVE